ISAPQNYARSGAGSHDDGRHVVPVWLLGRLYDAAIDAGRPYYLALFAKVHGRLGLGDLVAGTGFDFDESQCERPRRFVIRDDVDFARDPAAVFAMTDRGDEIGGDYPVALPLEKLGGQPLSVFSQGQMRRAGLIIFAKLPEKIQYEHAFLKSGST